MDLTKHEPAKHGQVAAPAIFRESLRHRVKIGFRNALAWTLLPAARLGNRSHHFLPILSYHRVLPDFPPGSSRSAVISPEAFEAQLSWLADEGYTALSLDEFSRMVESPRDAPPRPILLTFDDGYADSRLIAFEIGRRCGVKLNYFIPTGIIGREEWPYHWGIRPPQEEWHLRRYPELWRPLTWDEARELALNGHGVGCHGFIHRKLSSLDPAAMREEIEQGINTFIDQMDYHPRHFTIPWGDRTAYNDAVLAALRTNGITFIYTTRSLRATWPVAGDVLPRISIREHDDLASFARKLAGANDLVQHILLR